MTSTWVQTPETQGQVTSFISNKTAKTHVASMTHTDDIVEEDMRESG